MTSEKINMPKEFKLWPLEKLILYAKNSKIHPEEQINQIAVSIMKFGFNNPILIDKENGIVAGHGRFEAAKKLNLEKVPVVVLDYLDDDTKRAYIIADNKIAENSTWDYSALKEELPEISLPDFELTDLGFSGDELENIFKDEEEDEEEEDEDSIKEKKYILEIAFPNQALLNIEYDLLVARGLIVRKKNG